MFANSHSFKSSNLGLDAGVLCQMQQQVIDYIEKRLLLEDTVLKLLRGITILL